MTAPARPFMLREMHGRALRLLAFPLALSCALLGGARAEAQDARKFPVDPKTTTIAGIRAGMSERDVLARLGKPRSIAKGHSELEDRPTKTLRWNGVEIGFVGGDFYGLKCTGQGCRTDRGAKVGDGRAKVVGIYGAGNPPYEGATRDTLSYPLRGADVYLVFVFEKERVVAIEFFCDFS